MSRRLPLVLALTATVALAGCAGSSTAKKAKPALTAEKAKVVAAAGVLTDADLPGYTSEAQTHDASDDASDKALATCLGIPVGTFLARDFGKAFHKGTLEVDSSVDIATSAKDAQAQLAAISGGKGVGCLKTLLGGLIGSSGATVTSIELTPVSPAVQGADGSFGYQIAVALTAAGQTVTIKGFELGALVGQVEIDITDIATGGEPLGLEDSVALLNKVVARVTAAS